MLRLGQDLFFFNSVLSSSTLIIGNPLLYLLEDDIFWKIPRIIENWLKTYFFVELATKCCKVRAPLNAHIRGHRYHRNRRKVPISSSSWTKPTSSFSSSFSYSSWALTCGRPPGGPSNVQYIQVCIRVRKGDVDMMMSSLYV